MNHHRSLRRLARALPLLLPAALAAQPSSSNNVLTGTNVSAATGAITSVLGGVTFVNQGLVGVGRIDATAIDAWGESLGSVSGLQVTNWTSAGNGSYSGRFNFTPDRGYNAGTTFSNYAARIQAVDFTFMPYTGTATSGVAQSQFTLTYNSAASTKLTYDAGGGTYVTTTGLIPDSSTTLGGRTVPFVTVSNGSPTLPTSGGTTINRVSLDTEGLVLRTDGSGWVSDEYGANIYAFNSAKQITGVITPPAALIPTTSGNITFSSEVANTLGRRGNQGMEGVALSPDGSTLFGLMQSATIQDSGTGNQGRFNTRLLVYDVSSTTAPGAPAAEYVLQLPIGNDTGTGSPNRNFAQSEIIALDSTHLLVLTRDGNGKGVANTNAPVYKSVILVDLAAATNIAGTSYDATGGDITPSGTTLAPGITPVSWTEAVNLLNTAQLGKFDLNLNAGANVNLNTLSEKWEGLALVPTGVPNEFFLFVANDNDFISGSTQMLGLDGSTLLTYNATSATVPQNDTMFLAYKVTITGLSGSAIPEPSTFAALAGAGALGFALWRRRRRAARIANAGTTAVLAAAAAGAVALAPVAQAQVRITEVMSSSGTGGTPDWFEVTNFGPTAVDLTGFKMDDISFAIATAVSLLGVSTVAVGQSVVFIESAAPGTDIAAFRTFWGGIDGVSIGSYSGQGVGLSSAGDGVVLFDSTGTEVTRVSFGAATSGTSFLYDLAAPTVATLSVAGQNGAFVSANVAANVGSPGAIPEPSAYAALAGVGALGLALVRRRGGARRA